MAEAPAPAAVAASDARPAVGQRIIVLRQPWLDYIFLGMGGRIYSRVKVVGAVSLTTEELRSREQEHRWPADVSLQEDMGADTC